MHFSCFYSRFRTVTQPCDQWSCDKIFVDLNQIATDQRLKEPLKNTFKAHLLQWFWFVFFNITIIKMATVTKIYK